jgi:ABC-type Na+ transport system ATPase subunit NatA
MLAMAKRKAGKFSATKAVKANARERVGQPKPVRVVDTEPRTGRDVKHKPKLDELIRQEE